MKTHQLILAALLLLNAIPAGAVAPGQVIGWGLNISGEAAGVPRSLLSSTGVVTIAGQPLTDVTAVSAGLNHALALKKDGTVVGWGNNMSGRATGFNTESHRETNGLVVIGGQVLSNVTAIAACQYSLALKQDGTVVAWGSDASGKPVIMPPGLNNVVAISAGSAQGFALKKDGKVVSISGGNTPDGLTNVLAIAAAKEWFGNNLALKNDGTVVQWDCRNASLSRVVMGLSNVVAIAAGENHCLALKYDGTVFGWGNNGHGEATGVLNQQPPYSSKGLVRINGEILSNIIAIAAGNGYSLGLKKDGTIIGWGYSQRHFSDIPEGLSNVVSFAAGENFCLAITTNRAVAERFRQK